MQNKSELALVALLAVLACGVGASLPRLFGGAPPQLAGGNVWDTALGDARQLVSASFMEKADQYYHGGLSVENCDEGLAALPGRDAEKEHDGDHDHAHAQGGGAWSGRDPWLWINRRVHVQEHRHIRSDEAQELLPWLWAACRSAPQNIRAFQSSAYVLEKMLRRPGDAAELLREGIAHNPESGELEFSLGEVLLRSLRERAAAERAFAAAAAKLRPAAGEEGEEAAILKGRALFYVGYLALQRDDRARAEEALAMAESAAPGSAGTKGLHKLLRETAP